MRIFATATLLSSQLTSALRTRAKSPRNSWAQFEPLGFMSDHLLRDIGMQREKPTFNRRHLIRF